MQDLDHRPRCSLSSKRGVSEFAYYDNYLINNRSCIIAGVMATQARLSQEIVAARRMFDRLKERFGLQPMSLAADKSYGTGEFLSWLFRRQIAPHIPVLDRKQQTNGFYRQREFTRVPEENAYRCPDPPPQTPFAWSATGRRAVSPSRNGSKRETLGTISGPKQRIQA